MSRDERRRAMFELDKQVPDEGACAELGLAYAHRELTGKDKLIVGLHADTRSALVGVPLDHVVEDEESLLRALEGYRASARDPLDRFGGPLADAQMTAMMDRHRLELAEHVAGRLGRIEGVAAVALGGSMARRETHPDSDIDLGIYYSPDNPPSIVELRRLAEELDDRHPKDAATNLWEWGPWINGGKSSPNAEPGDRRATISRVIRTDFTITYTWARSITAALSTIRTANSRPSGRRRHSTRVR